jgi:nicotinic acid phosphoribosyltransferase
MNPIFYIDFYKVGHVFQYPTNVTQVWSNWTPRTTRIEGRTDVVHFGLQYFIKKYLIEEFNTNFFNVPLETVLSEYRELISKTLNDPNPKTEHIEWLHRLGYLPIKIYSVPEGDSTPLGVPSMVITNTVPEGFWLPNYFETILSNILWKPSTSATTARDFRRLCIKWAKEAGETDFGFIDYQCHDFSMRGMSGLEDAVISGMGHLLSFSGTDTIPAILAAKKYYNAELNVGGSVPACYDKNTEILTNSGFKFFRDLDKSTDLVAQYNSDGSIEFVKPLEYFEDHYNGLMYHFYKEGYKYVDFCVTPNHRMITYKKNKLALKQADSPSVYNSKNKVIVSGYKKDGLWVNLSDLDRLKIAFQADGSYPNRDEKYNGKVTNCFPIRFSLKKKRKVERLTDILNRLGYEYTKTKYENDYYSFYIKVPNEKLNKTFSWIDLNKVTSTWIEDFVEELSHWDGCKRKEESSTVIYSSTVKENINVLECLAVLGGYKTKTSDYADKREAYNRKLIYSIVFTKKTSVVGENVFVKTIPYDDVVYCVSVPSKMIVVRRNGVVGISGNTEHSVMSAGEYEKEFETLDRLINEVYRNGIVSIVSDTWDLWKVLTDFIPRLKNDILNRNGKVVIRPDSGDPVKIIIGNNNYESTNHNYSTDKHPAFYGTLDLLRKSLGVTHRENGMLPLINNAGAIYGDSITLGRADAILDGIVNKLRLSPYNMVFGVGSYTYEYCTRDTNGFAMKATAVRKNGEIVPCFKSPVTDDGGKISHKGIVSVYKNSEGCYTVKQNSSETDLDTCDFVKVFEDSELLVEHSFDEIRQRVRN